MYQHIIQKSWIKQFAYQGKVKSVDFSTLEYELKKPDCIGGEVNFQTEEQEKGDSQFIESRAIQILHSMKKIRSKPTEIDRDYLNRFVALHMSS